MIKNYNFDDIDVISEEKSEIHVRKEQENQRQQKPMDEFRNFRARLHKNISEHKGNKLIPQQIFQQNISSIEKPRVISPLNLMDIFDSDVPPNPGNQMF